MFENYQKYGKVTDVFPKKMIPQEGVLFVFPQDPNYDQLKGSNPSCVTNASYLDNCKWRIINPTSHVKSVVNPETVYNTTFRAVEKHPVYSKGSKKEYSPAVFSGEMKKKIWHHSDFKLIMVQYLNCPKNQKNQGAQNKKSESQMIESEALPLESADFFVLEPFEKASLTKFLSINDARMSFKKYNTAEKDTGDQYPASMKPQNGVIYVFPEDPKYDSSDFCRKASRVTATSYLDDIKWRIINPTSHKLTGVQPEVVDNTTFRAVENHAIYSKSQKYCPAIFKGEMKKKIWHHRDLKLMMVQYLNSPIEHECEETVSSENSHIGQCGEDNPSILFVSIEEKDPLE